VDEQGQELFYDEEEGPELDHAMYDMHKAQMHENDEMGGPVHCEGWEHDVETTHEDIEYHVGG
jgi:hypothetical protein